MSSRTFFIIDGKHVDKNPTKVKFASVAGKRYSVLVQVRNTGFRAYLDGVLMCSFLTDYKNITPHDGWTIPNKFGLGFGSYTMPTQLLVAEVIEVSGRGKRVR